MSDIGSLYVGRSLLRREDDRLLRDQAQFIAGLSCRAYCTRFWYAARWRMRARSVDPSRAAAPGVVLALAGADLLQLLPPVPERQISLPRKWTSVIQHKISQSAPSALRNWLRSRGLDIYRDANQTETRRRGSLW